MSLHTVHTLDGLELASERVDFELWAVTLYEPVIFKARGSTKYAPMPNVVSRTVPWAQIRHVDVITSEASRRAVR